MRIFVDTSVWFAAVNGNDSQHARAKAALSGQAGLLTSTLVVAETWRRLHQNLHWQAAESFWHSALWGDDLSTYRYIGKDCWIGLIAAFAVAHSLEAGGYFILLQELIMSPVAINQIVIVGDIAPNGDDIWVLKSHLIPHTLSSLRVTSISSVDNDDWSFRC